MADYYNAPEEDYDRLNRQVVVLLSQFLVINANDYRNTMPTISIHGRHSFAAWKVLKADSIAVQV